MGLTRFDSALCHNSLARRHPRGCLANLYGGSLSYKAGPCFTKGYDMATMPKEVMDAFSERSVLCCDSLYGIPNSWLENRAAAKALLAFKIYDIHGYCYTPEFGHDTEMGIDVNGHDREVQPFTYFDVDFIINAALKLRARGADFGELNSLIDSFKEEA